MPLADVGFSNGGGYFNCVYDTSYGGTWLGGFAYSNMTDSATLHYMNDHSAKTATGYNNSLGYVIGFQGFGASPYIKLIDTSSAGDSVLGFYVTNTTYAYKTIRDGYLGATQFGGLSGNDSDWFKLTIYGYNNGVQNPDTVDFYLADYRFTNNANDYIVGDWQWVDLTSLGLVDSVTFLLTTTDTNQYGALTPTYFAMDNFTTKAAPTSIANIVKAGVGKMYPNPATDVLYVELNNSSIKTLNIVDITGKMVLTQKVSSNKEAINTSSLQAGTYFLQLSDGHSNYSSRFVKQ
jgi:hypothetical protein